MNQKLSELFQKKVQANQGPSVDWDDRRDKYVGAVKALYQQIEAMLTEPIQKKTASVQRRQKQLNESYIGNYAVDDMILTIGNEQVRFSPRGRNIVGAAGRVDVLGERNNAVLILERDSDSKWAIVQSRQPTIRTEPFDESAFVELLKSVMRK